MQRSTKSTVLVAALALAAFVTSFAANIAGQGPPQASANSGMDAGAQSAPTTAP